MLFGTRRQILQLPWTNTLSTVFRITVFVCSYGPERRLNKNTLFPALCNGVSYKVYNYFYDKYWHLEHFFPTHNIVICTRTSTAAGFPHQNVYHLNKSLQNNFPPACTQSFLLQSTSMSKRQELAEYCDNTQIH
jgi:hypothetical protein